MAGAVIPDESLAQCLDDILRGGASQLIPWEALLFVNDLEPDGAVTLADLEEPSWASYARRTLDPAAWSVPAVVAHVAHSQWGESTVDFWNTSSPTETVYGYAIYDSGLGMLRVCERFEPGDIRAIAAGGAVRVVPRVSFRSFPVLE